VGHAQLLAAERKSTTPGGGGGGAAAGSIQNRDALLAKRKSKAMSIAMKPGQQIFMNAFMMYMSGKTLNIFSISITSMAILSPLASLFTIDKAFGNLELDSQMPKLIYAACNLAWLALGLYKMSSMRLLPTTSADWTDSIVWKDMLETSSIPPIM
jgi:ER membrane protein complex subunit 4